MHQKSIDVAVEGPLDQAVLAKLLHSVDPTFNIRTPYIKSSSELRKKVKGYHAASIAIPFVLLTDLDSSPCPSNKINDWLGSRVNPNFVFRIAVREVESWLLADRSGIASYLKVSTSRIPLYPEKEMNPKQTLIEIAKSSRSRVIRGDIVPAESSTAKQGKGYNPCLIQFVNKNWNINQAREVSRSLERAYLALENLSARLAVD